MLPSRTRSPETCSRTRFRPSLGRDPRSSWGSHAAARAGDPPRRMLRLHGWSRFEVVMTMVTFWLAQLGLPVTTASPGLSLWLPTCQWPRCDALLQPLNPWSTTPSDSARRRALMSCQPAKSCKRTQRRLGGSGHNLFFHRCIEPNFFAVRTRLSWPTNTHTPTTSHPLPTLPRESSGSCKFSGGKGTVRERGGLDESETSRHTLAAWHCVHAEHIRRGRAGPLMWLDCVYELPGDWFGTYRASDMSDLKRGHGQ